jgi:hypothetical protein
MNQNILALRNLSLLVKLIGMYSIVQSLAHTY